MPTMITNVITSAMTATVKNYPHITGLHIIVSVVRIILYDKYTELNLLRARISSPCALGHETQ